MARIAARFISSEALKSGNPCDRFIPFMESLMRVISRMTDSVKDSVRWERGFIMQGLFVQYHFITSQSLMSVAGPKGSSYFNTVPFKGFFFIFFFILFRTVCSTETAIPMDFKNCVNV